MVEVAGEEGDEKKIVLKRRETPKVVTLPNRTAFVARYERINKKQLPANIRVKNVRKEVPRRKNRDILPLDDMDKIKKKTRQKK